MFLLRFSAIPQHRYRLHILARTLPERNLIAFNLGTQRGKKAWMLGFLESFHGLLAMPRLPPVCCHRMPGAAPEAMKTHAEGNALGPTPAKGGESPEAVSGIPYGIRALAPTGQSSFSKNVRLQERFAFVTLGSQEQADAIKTSFGTPPPAPAPDFTPRF